MATKNLLRRYLWLIDTIYQAENIPFEEIDRQWRECEWSDGEPLPLRTFHNHKDCIEDLFGICIGCHKRGGYFYHIKDREAFSNGDMRSWVFNILKVNNLISENPQLKNKIFFEPFPSGQSLLTLILEAISNEQRLEIHYKTVWHNYIDTFEVEPYCIKAFKQRWYMIARDPLINKIRIYALDDIQSIRLSKRKFKIHKNFDLDLFLKDCFGMVADEQINPEIIKIKADDRIRKVLHNLPLHPSQEEIETNDRYSVFKYFICPTADFTQAVLSFGEQLEIVWPPSYREEFVKKVRELNKVYQ
jgi:hypothetical protein